MGRTADLNAKVAAGFKVDLVKIPYCKGEVLFLERHTRSPSAIYTLTQVPGGGVGVLRLTAIWVAILMLAFLAAEFLAQHISRILPHT